MTTTKHAGPPRETDALRRARRSWAWRNYWLPLVGLLVCVAATIILVTVTIMVGGTF